MIGTMTRVIGWYHSHPHISVLPSHVDVRTQPMHQLLDSGFIGLTFSCFSEDAQKVGRIHVLAFQSLDGKQNHTTKLVSRAAVRKSTFTNLESPRSSSDNAGAVVVFSGGESMELDTGHSRTTTIASEIGVKSPRLGVFFANADAKSGNASHLKSIRNTVNDVDPMDMSEGIQEAMHLSNLETSGADFVRKEIPLYVVPTSSLLSLDSPLLSFTNLQHVLYEEEKNTYNEALRQNSRRHCYYFHSSSRLIISSFSLHHIQMLLFSDRKVHHPISFIHHSSTYKASLCKMIEYWFSKIARGKMKLSLN